MQLKLSGECNSGKLQLRFGPDGLVPAIVQDINSKEVLMLAYMNRESLERTLAQGETWFFSRSRRQLWHKGETSGHRQLVKEAYYDCDSDALLFKVEQIGVACHEGDFSCFHHSLARVDNHIGGQTMATDTDNRGREVGSAGLAKILSDVYQVVLDRKRDLPEGSYTAYLLRSGLDKILKKVGEEASETIIAAKNMAPAEVLYEMADLYYHTLVLLAWYGLKPEDLARELASRHKQ